MHSFESYVNECEKNDAARYVNTGYKLDKNINEVLENDMKITCQFSDSDTCTMKNGSYKEILEHQT